jgi:ssDNA-binding Zn-finger/Zn-ribbon topoisomerase 1
MINERSEIFTITDEECPLCGEYLIIVKYDNKKAKLCGLSEYCGYILLLGTASE